MNDNDSVIRKVMAEEDLKIFIKPTGDMYYSKKKGKYNGHHLRNMVSNGFNGMPISDILTEHSEELELWVNWLLREDRQY